MADWAVQNSLSKQKTMEVVLLIILGLICSGLQGLSFVLILLPIMSVLMLRSLWECLLFLIACSLQLLISPMNLSSLYLISAILYLSMNLAKLFHLNLIHFMKFLVSIVCAGYLIQMNQDIRVILVLCFVQYGFVSLHEQELRGFKAGAPLPISIALLFFLACGILLTQYMPMEISIYLMLTMIVICAMAPSKGSIFAYLFLLALGFQVIQPIYALIYFASCIRSDKVLLTALIVIYGIIVPANLWMNIVLVSCLILYLIWNEGKQIMSETEVATHNQKAILKRQLSSFSGIFESMSQYYESLSSIEAEMLGSMALALNHAADSFLKEEDHLIHKIEDILIGYKIEYEECLVKEDEQGRLTVQLALYHFKKSEVKEVLLPLLNMILPSKVMLSEPIVHQHLIGLTTYEFTSAKPIKLDIYADSCKHFDISGDCFSVFHHTNICYCLISDGMGYGGNAFQISSCISNIFQRMIIANIDPHKALGCINLMIQSDIYATMDLLAFDRLKKTVRLSKSAASPTYLIRNNELYAITGHSLPIGIIAHIHVDSIELQVEENDWFLMSSDGVYMNEIIEWMQTKEDESAHEEVTRFMQILNKQPRKDDSTILLIRVMKE